MLEAQKTRIVPLDDNSDYALWRICVRDAISSRKLGVALNRMVDMDNELVVEMLTGASNFFC